MSEKIDYFSIKGILNIAIIDHTTYFNRLFDSFYTHYANFKSCGKIEDCDLVIELGKFNPTLDNSYNVGDGKYFFQEDYMYVPKEQHKGAKWRFEVQGLNGGKTVAKIDCNFVGRIFITGNVIDFLIHLKLLEKGYPVIHASAVCKNGNAFAFSSRGGTGKTTIALEMVANGFNFIGDNYVIIHNEEVLSFPTSLSIFTYNLAPIISKNLKPKERIHMVLKNILYKMTGGYAKFFTKINPRRVSNNVTSSKLHTIMLLIPNMEIVTGQMQRKKTKFPAFIKKITYNQMLEFYFFTRYIEEYSYLFPETNFSSHWNNYEEGLINNLKDDIKHYFLIVPLKYDKNNINKFLEIMEV